MGGSDDGCGSELLEVIFSKQADTAPSGNGTIEPDNIIHFLFQSTRKPGYMYEANCFNLIMCVALLSGISAQMLPCIHVHVL